MVGEAECHSTWAGKVLTSVVRLFLFPNEKTEAWSMLHLPLSYSASSLSVSQVSLYVLATCYFSFGLCTALCTGLCTALLVFACSHLRAFAHVISVLNCLSLSTCHFM